MATYGSKVRKYKAAHAAAGGRARREVQLQEAYISTYQNFSAYAAGTKKPTLKLFKPQQGKQRGGYTEAQRKAAEPYMAMEWYRPEDIIDSKGGAISHRGTSNFRLDKFIRYQAASNRPTKGWFQSIADQYKGKALAAELGQLANAKSGLSGWASSYDTSHISSARKGQRNAAAASTQTKARKAEVAEATAAASRASGPASNYEWRSVGYTDAEIKNNANTGFKKFEYVLKTDKTKDSEPVGIASSIDNFFGTKRDEKGQVIKHDAYNYLSPEQQTKSQKEKTSKTFEYISSGLSGILPSQMQQQRNQEKQLEKKLEEVKKEIKAFEKKHPSTSDRDGNETYYESVHLTEKKNKILKQLQDINNDQKVVAQALQSTDYNTVMYYLAKHDVITDETRKDYLQKSNPNTAVLEQEVQITSNMWELQQSKTKAIGDDIKHLEGLQRNNIGGKNQTAIDVFVRGLEDKHGDSLNTVYDQGGTTTEAKRVGNKRQGAISNMTNVDGIIAQMKGDNILSVSQAKQEKLRQNYLGATTDLSFSLTNEQRVSRATKFNKQVESKREFEDLTGMEAGSNADASMASWYKSIGETRPDQRMEGYVNRDSNSDWFASWLNNDKMFSKDDDLTLWGSTDDKKQSALQSKADILNKYDSWGAANAYISADLHEWKGDLNTYYGNYYSAPNVTTQEVSKSWFGSPEVTGDSFVGHVNQEMGGVRGGAYWVQDVKKLNVKTKEYEKTMEQQIEDRKAKLVGLRLEQSRLDEAHTALRPVIKSAVESGVKHGNISVDENLAKELGTSSQALYDINYNVAAVETEQSYLEKSLAKTISEREELEQQRKVREYNQIQNNIGSGAPRSRGWSSPGRPNVKSRTNTGTSNLNTSQSKQRARRRDGLGGLVV